MRYWIRVTKYDFRLRDEYGYFTKHDWSSISQIGEKFEEGILTEKHYLETESNYIDAVLYCMQEVGITKLIIKDLERYGFRFNNNLANPLMKNLYNKNNHDAITIKEIPDYMRLLLREHLWCRLEDDNFRLSVYVGFNYYLYFGISCPLSESLEIAIHNAGLFIEHYVSPYVSDKED